MATTRLIGKLEPLIQNVEPQAQELLDILVAALQRPSASSTRARAALSALEALLQTLPRHFRDTS